MVSITPMLLAATFAAALSFGGATTFPDRARLIWVPPPAYPTMRGLDRCSFYPRQPLAPPPHPAWTDDVCALTTCPSAPGQCWEDSACSSFSGEAVCEAHRPKRFGSPCNVSAI